MKSVGEAMAIGRTFKEALQKALRSLEVGARGFGGGGSEKPGRRDHQEELGTPNAERIFYIRYAFKAGYTVEQIFDLTKIDPWFLHHLHRDPRDGGRPRDRQSLATIDTALLRRAKQFGFSDAQLAHILKSDLNAVRADRKGAGSTRPSGSSTPARPSSRRSRPTTTPATARRTRSCPPTSRRS
jgi:carbamoyl-phosphate synthase large subunit